MTFNPHTPADRREMLQAVGVETEHLALGSIADHEHAVDVTRHNPDVDRLQQRVDEALPRRQVGRRDRSRGRGLPQPPGRRRARLSHSLYIGRPRRRSREFGKLGNRHFTPIANASRSRTRRPVRSTARR